LAFSQLATIGSWDAFHTAHGDLRAGNDVAPLVQHGAAGGQTSITIAVTIELIVQYKAAAGFCVTFTVIIFARSATSVV